MTRTKIKKHHEKGEHIWEALKRYEKSPDEQIDENISTNDPEEVSNLLKKLKPNEYLETISIQANEVNTKKFFQYIEGLKECGLDIGKENSEYRFKMPLPQKGENCRNLMIFRRWKK